MDLRSTITDFFAGGDRAVIPHVSVDCTVFGFHDGQLTVLLLKWRSSERWTLPGGYVGRDESLDAAAERVLRERTGLDRIYLQQFHAFGDAERGEAELRTRIAALGIAVPPGHWIGERHVSVGYLALVDVAKVRPTPGAPSDAGSDAPSNASPEALTEECRWWDARARPPLAFDHDAVVARALQTLRDQAGYLPLGRTLLPEKFTMPELQRLHEAVLGRPLDRRNFQKKIRDLGFVERLPERKRGGAHRAPFLYRFVPRAGDDASGMCDAGPDGERGAGAPRDAAARPARVGHV